nr:ganglioside GM2 activator [Anser cygnoides]
MPAAGLVLALCALLQLCPAALGGLRPQLLVERSGSRRLSKVGGFSWENCGEGKDPVVLQSLSVAPDPISIPGNLRISAAVNGNKAMASPLKVGHRRSPVAVPLSPTPPPVSPAQNRVALEPTPSLMVELGG